VCPKCFRGGPSEVDVGSIDGLGPRVWGHQPKHGVRIHKCRIDDCRVTVRAFDYVDAVSDFVRKTGRVTYDHTERLMALK
jgi:hypothetical protein